MVRRHVKHITYNTILENSFPQESLSPDEMSFTVVITIYQRWTVYAFTPKKNKSQTSSFSPNPKPFEISACTVREEVSRSAPNTADWCAVSASRTCILPRWEEGRWGALRGHCLPAETCAFLILLHYKFTFKTLKFESIKIIIHFKLKWHFGDRYLYTYVLNLTSLIA